MNKEKAAVFDCDDVLLWWTERFVYWYNRTQGKLELPAVYESLDREMGCTLDEARDLFYEFNTRSWEFGAMESYGYAKATIELIIEHNRTHDDKVHIIVCSKSPNQATSKLLREANLKSVFGDVFSEIYCIGEDKKGPVLDHINTKYDVIMFVDDHHKNIISVQETVPEIDCYWLRVPCNQHITCPENATEVRSTHHLFDLVDERLRKLHE